MKKNHPAESGFLNLRVLLVYALSLGGVLLAMFSFAANPPSGMTGSDGKPPVDPVLADKYLGPVKGKAKGAGASTPLAPTGPGWSLVTSANTSATQTNYLNDTTCASASDCWAVGYYNNGSGGSGVAQTLIEHWDGAAWAIFASPNVGPGGNLLEGVTCTSTANCWAVGYYFNASSVAQTLVERWNGTAWSIVTSNNSSPAQNNYLYDVTCASAATCWAVGSFFNGSFTQTLIERWDGTSWATATSPVVAYYLNGVTCASTSDCWAVGSYYPTGSSHAQTLIEHWDGTSWALVSSPNPTDVGDNYLSSVTCPSASECWAVGYYDPYGTGGEVALPFIERWNGASLCPSCPSWSIFTSPSIGVAYLKDVTCSSASQCWAVGTGIDPDATNPAYYAVIEQWNGSSWQVVTSPNRPSPNNNYLNGVVCASASTCWAVGYAGYYQNGPVAQTLIEEYSLTIPPLVSIGSRQIHGGTPFEVDLLNVSPGIECRSPGATGTPGVDYKIVFSFVNNVTSCGTASTGSLSRGPNSNQCTVDLTGAPNQQYVKVTLNNVLDSQNNTGNTSATMGVLIGDVNGSGRVDSGDVFLVRQQSLQDAGASNFRHDINASGRIDSGDIFLARQNSLNALPPPPP